MRDRAGSAEAGGKARGHAHPSAGGMSGEPERVSLVARAPWWGGDLQTLRNHLLAPFPELQSTTTTLHFPTRDDSGDVLIGQLETPHAGDWRDQPLVVLVHGLTGCEDSTYVRETARVQLLRGRRVLRLNLRGAGPSARTARGYYHAGCYGDLLDVFAALEPHRAGQRVVIIGYSLGGNVVLNLLGRPESREIVDAAATVSAPIVPMEASKRIMAVRNVLYQRFLLKRMKSDVLSAADLTPQERAVIEDASSVYAFDDQFVAPRNGFVDAPDYYGQTAGLQFVPAIAQPTLLLHAADDPWIPHEAYLEAARLAPGHVDVVVTSTGGHVGFHERGRDETWHDHRIDRFIDIVFGAGAP